VPLAFESLNQGVVAFGFFNVDTDLLLLEHYFFFAEEFCASIVHLAERKEQISFETSWDVYDIPKLAEIGDLSGAIHGLHYTGFIGEVYRRFPFPGREEDFKQKPEGFQNRSAVKSILEKYARTTTIPVRADKAHDTVAVGECLFARKVFHRLIEYVWVGGYPQWRDGIRPGYVVEMRRTMEKSPNWLFAGITFPKCPES
jgi:hypothetical protein